MKQNIKNPKEKTCHKPIYVNQPGQWAILLETKKERLVRFPSCHDSR